MDLTMPVPLIMALWSAGYWKSRANSYCVVLVPWNRRSRPTPYICAISHTPRIDEPLPYPAIGSQMVDVIKSKQSQAD